MAGRAGKGKQVTASAACWRGVEAALAAVFLLVLLAVAAPSPAAASEWVQFQEYEYMLIPGKHNLQNAVKKCAVLDAYIALPRSVEENTFFYGLVQLNRLGGNNRVIMGGADTAVEGQFLSLIDGQPLEYDDWGPGQPDNWKNREDCITFREEHWNDASCTYTRRVFCQRDSLSGRWIKEGDKEYFFSPDILLSFNDAILYCADYSATLAEARDANAVPFAARFAWHGPTDEVWLNFNDTDSDECEEGKSQDLSGQYSCKDGEVFCLDTGYGESVPVTPTSDRLCTQCQPGTRWTTTVLPTGETVGVCTACSSGTYQDKPGQTNCISQPSCDPGTYILREDVSFKRECRACNGVTEYQDESNQYECKRVTVCTSSEYEVEPPTAELDRRCRSCELGITFLDAALQQCQPVTECAPGTVESEEPTLVSDRECRAETFACTDGQQDGDGPTCACSVDHCHTCTKQPLSEDKYGAILLQVNRHPQLSTLVRPCQQLGPQDDYVAGCVTECRNETDCTAFFVGVSGAEEGICCLYSSFSAIGSYNRPGGSFYALSQCDVCDDGYFKSGIGCRKLSVPPSVGQAEQAITLPLTATLGTEVARVNATVEAGYGPLSFTPTRPSEVFAVNASTGVVTLMQPLAVASAISITIAVADAREECFALNEAGTDVTITAGGCVSHTTLNIQIAVFIDCPKDESYYLAPELDALEVSWTPPRLPSFLSLDVHNNTPAPPVSFGEGIHTVEYIAGPLDVGGNLQCVFDVALRYGFSILVESIGHATSGPLLQDFLLADANLVDGGARPRGFSGDIISRPLAIGLQSKPGLPFTIFTRNSVQGRVVVQLQWCTSGSVPSDPAAFVNGTTTVKLLQPSDPLLSASLVFTDRGSGVTDDGRCFRIAAESSPVAGTLSFSGVDIAFTYTGPARARRSPSSPSVTIRDYAPREPNFVVVQFGTEDGSPLDDNSGPFLSQEDTIAPRWLNCPTAPVVAHALPGEATAVADWEELVAVDNVQVVETHATHMPGDSFSVVQSPHTVTYTASDGTLSTECTFQVEVTFDPITADVVATSDAVFSVSHQVLPLLHTQTFTHHLIGGPNDTSLASFTLDAAFVTAIRFTVLPPPGEHFFVRTVAGAERGQLEVDFVFSVAGASVALDSLAFDDDAVVAYELGQFALDTTPAADGLDADELQDSLAPKGTIDHAHVLVDGSAGVIVVRGTATDTFRRGFSFGTMSLQVSFPLGRNFTSLAQALTGSGGGGGGSAAATTPAMALGTNTTTTTTTTPTVPTMTASMPMTTAANSSNTTATGGVASSATTAVPSTSTATAAAETLPFLMQSGSFLGFKVFLPANDPDDPRGFLSLLDTQAPFFRRCPFSLHRDIDVVLATVPREPHAIANWTLPVVDDNRGRDQLTLTSNVPAGGVFALQAPGDAPYAVQYTVADLFGNTATCDFFVAVRDFEAPRVLVVDDVVVTLPSAPYSPGHAVLATVTPEQVRAATNTTDNSGAFTWTAPATALALGTGETDVMVEAEDEWGNKGSAVVRVRVLDTTPPTLFCNDPSPVVTPGVQAEAAAVNFTAPSYVDNVPTAATLTYSHAPGSLFPVGTTHVNVTATDASGNAALCVLAVEVIPFQAATAPDNTNIVAGASGGGAFLLVLLAVFAALYYRQRKRMRRPQNWDEIFEMIEQFKGRKDGSDGPVVPRELNRANIKLLEELGKGAFGIVYKGLLTEAPIPGYLVACKSLHAKATASERIELMEEAAVVAQFDHPNVLQLIGVVSVGKPVLVVLEFMEYGSLRSYVQDNDVDEATRLLFAGDCAEGLNHVHSKGFVHRDIAARNILVSSERRCKVADFGLARDTEESDYYRSRGGQLPVRWSAPEALEDRKFTRATDVWSFGILCHEIWTRGKMPYDGWGNQKVWVMVCDGYRLPKAETCRDVVYEQLLACWHAEAERRPSLADLAAFFRDEYEAYTGESLQPKDEYLAIGDTPHSGTKKPRRSLSGTLGTLLSGFRRRSSQAGMVHNPVYQDVEMSQLVEVAEEDGDGSCRRNQDPHQLYDMGDGGDADAAGNISIDSDDDGRDDGDEARQLYDLGDVDEGVGQTALTTNAASSRSGSTSTSDRDSVDDMPQGFGDTFEEPVTQQVTPTKRKHRGTSVVDEHPFGFSDSSANEDNLHSDDDLLLYGNVDTHHRQRDGDSGGDATAATNTTAPIAASDVGRRVRVQGYECLGTIAFVGKHATKGTDRVGVILDLPRGLNNGTVGGVQYFSCEHNKGILCVPAKVSLMDDCS
ncbi:TK/RTKC protein kinase [Salpingoeca rosetta]|uniref:TK/RTKC protein kinase n=1 Tax=Salpingoeca rosetta (strain ATCC 50818 / BSB-021) TaxID=946362 RepID=F2TZH9_SALR5|nr:TK/RTKC protein kinase [Salpingoeca rosetta]EGD79003.1 TK/RTKC protein kinase [Salpingoeca rosetta]|eukprot:XP_004997959.1 TK/RTKC protein kinase [Salpingoeca rosetta]